MNELSRIAFETGDWHLHPRLNVHDDLTFVVPDDDRIIDDSIERIYRVMLTPPYEWINVPMGVECFIGPHWAAMEPVGKFWSNKDL